MPSRQLQPAAHSLLAGYLLLRISLHEWLLWNILGAAAKMACICVHGSYSKGLFLGGVSLRIQCLCVNVCDHVGREEICLCQRWQCRPLRTLAVLCRRGSSCLAKKKKTPPLCTGFNHSTVNFKLQCRKGGCCPSLQNFPLIFSFIPLPPLRSNPLQLRVLPFLLITLHHGSTCANCGANDRWCFAFLKELEKRGQQINIQPRGFWKARLSQADGHHIIRGKLLAEAVGGV